MTDDDSTTINPPTIATTIQIDPEALREHNERWKAQIEVDQTRRSAKADQARAALAERPGAETTFAALDKISSGRPDPETIEVAQQMTNAERSAAAACEAYLIDAGKLSEALHHLLPFCAELQKLAKDARYSLMTPHMVSSEGHKPTGTTINHDALNLLTTVTVYPTSRPGVRFVLGASVDFTDVVAELKADVHCDLSAPPYQKKLEPFKLTGKRDCIGEMAEYVASHRKLEDYCKSNPRDRSFVASTQNFTAGVLFPVAFGSDIVMIKLCVDHILALISKYGIQPRECGIEESWESIGNYW